MMRTLAAALLLALLPSAGPEQFEVSLWTGEESLEERAEVVATHDHPCGSIAVLRLSRMPRHRGNGRAALDSELVVETGRNGRARHRWSVPVDYRPLAVRGREILIDQGGQRLWIGTDRRIRRAAPGESYPSPIPFQCPTRGAHAESDYAICADFTDLESGRRRSLHYEAPCT